MKKLNYRFHNPNSAEATADYIVKILIESNRHKLEAVLLEHHIEVQADEKTEDAVM